MRNRKTLFLILAIFTTMTFSLAASDNLEDTKYAAINEINFYTYKLVDKTNEFIDVMEELHDFLFEIGELTEDGEIQDILDEFLGVFKDVLTEMYSYNIEILLARTNEQIQDFKYEALGDNPDQDLEDLKNDIDTQVQEFKELMNMYKSLLN